jgi:hypothetical protein
MDVIAPVVPWDSVNFVAVPLPVESSALPLTVTSIPMRRSSRRTSAPSSSKVLAPTVSKRTRLTITEPKPLTVPEYTELVGVTVPDVVLLLSLLSPPQATTDNATASAAIGPQAQGLSLKSMMVP